jgi:CheY-like chemotaxis protein
MLPDILTKEEFKLHLRYGIEILAVEDKLAKFILTKHCLRDSGITNNIIWFQNGEEVLNFLSSDGHRSSSDHKFIMLLDIMTPKVDGIEVLKRINIDGKLSYIQVVMLTASDQQEQARLCYKLRSSAHIIKPPGTTLLKAIKRVAKGL